MKITLQAAKTSNPVTLVPQESLTQRRDELSHSIARRAYELFEADGRIPGRELEHWSLAEAELLHPVQVGVIESDDNYEVHAGVADFVAGDLKVGIAPEHLTIAGTRSGQRKRTVEKDDNPCATQIFRTLELSSAVDTSKVTATVQDGVLELVIPKIRATLNPNLMSRSA
jgi:HSP20 family molecular chaperone IbpA